MSSPYLPDGCSDEDYDGTHEPDPFDYSGLREYKPTCPFLIGYWKNVQCDEPLHGEFAHCKAHAIEVVRRDIADPRNDAEMLAMYQEELDELLGVVALKIAA